VAYGSGVPHFDPIVAGRRCRVASQSRSYCSVSDIAQALVRAHFRGGRGDRITKDIVCRARALFGESEECITTMKAWQMMVLEARWVGRALFDAEEVVLGGCQAPEGGEQV
jgi:hypothetical protein